MQSLEYQKIKVLSYRKRINALSLLNHKELKGYLVHCKVKFKPVGSKTSDLLNLAIKKT